jgi:hypothetical protein
LPKNDEPKAVGKSAGKALAPAGTVFAPFFSNTRDWHTFLQTRTRSSAMAKDARLNQGT